MICDKCGLEMVSGQFGNHLTKECQHCEITLFLTDEGEVCGRMEPIEDEIQAKIDEIFQPKTSSVLTFLAILAVIGFALFPIFLK